VIKAVTALLITLSLSVPLTGQKSPSETSLPACPTNESPIPEKMTRPKYPKEALHNGQSGNVELRAVVAADGKTKELTTLEGAPEFSQSATEGVRHWRFHPVQKSGKPVETIYRVNVRFDPLLREANSDVELESPQPEPSNLVSAATVPHWSAGEQVHHSSEPGIIPPKALYSPEPELSEDSRKDGRGGNVTMALIVGSDGLPRDLKLACSSIPESDQNAIDAVKQWRFSPATKDGKPVAFAVEVEVSFKVQ